MVTWQVRAEDFEGLTLRRVIADTEAGRRSLGIETRVDTGAVLYTVTRRGAPLFASPSLSEAVAVYNEDERPREGAGDEPGGPR